MDKKLVLELDNHNVFYVKNENISYYITIPKNFDTTSICIELKSKMSNFNLDMNDELWVMENVKNTFSYIDTYNITLVLPILNEDECSILEKIDTNNYEIVDKILGATINSAYLNLKQAEKEIEKEVILVNNDRYKSFINWFITKYKDRVVCKNLLAVIQMYNANATTYKKFETPAITFVVGNYNSEVTAPKIEKAPDPVVDNMELKPQVSSGFTSYWLLVIITIVVSVIVALIAFIY